MGAQVKLVEGSGPLVEELPFSKAEFDRRLRLLRSAMLANDLDCFVSFTPENMYYITGHDSPGYYFFQATIVCLTDLPVNVLRRIETSNTLLNSWSRRAVGYEDRDDPVEATLATLELLDVASKRVGIEADSFFVTPSRFQKIVDGISKRGGNTKQISLIENLRLIKSSEEIAHIRKGARIVEIGLRAAIDASAEGVTENDVAGAMWKALVSAGGEYAGLPPFIVSGPRSSLCHATWGGRRLEKGDSLAYELPGVVKRYIAPLFRCGTVGPAPDDARVLSDVCRSSLEALIQKLRPGVTSHDVHRASRANFERQGFGELHGHRSGYSVGINYPPDWGEGHIFSLWEGDDREVQANMMFHLVPGVIVPKRHLISVTETVLVTESGCEVITEFPRELFTV